jgi:Peptidase family M28
MYGSVVERGITDTDPAGEPRELRPPPLSTPLTICSSLKRLLFMALSSRGASQPQGFALPWTAAIHAVSSHQFIESANVAAKIVGSDPVLRNQYVIYTAHLDHLGICPPVEGDNVCHGTIDNASGPQRNPNPQPLNEHVTAERW